MHHLYIENPREHALAQIESYGRRRGLGHDARSVLPECLAEAWDDGHAEMTLGALTSNVGISAGAAHAALRELGERGVIELHESTSGVFVVRPLFLASEIGTQAGVGWWQRLVIDNEV